MCTCKTALASSAFEMAFLFTILILAIDAAKGSSCDQSVVEIVSKTTSDAYVDLQSNGNNKKNYGTKNGLFLQNEGKCSNNQRIATNQYITVVELH